MRVAAARRHEAQDHRVVGFRTRACQLFEQANIDRVSLGLENVERERDIRGGQFRSVGETRFGAEQKAIFEPVGRVAHGAREQTIDRIGLVAVAGHQRIETGGHAGGAVALARIDVERIEGVEVLIAASRADLHRQQAALRRGRVHIVEMLEVGRKSEIAKRRQAVGLDRVVGEAAQRRQRGDGERRRTLERAAPCQSDSHTACVLFSTVDRSIRGGLKPALPGLTSARRDPRVEPCEG